MATDLLGKLGNTYDESYAASALRESKWQNPAQSTTKSNDYGSNEISGCMYVSMDSK